MLWKGKALRVAAVALVAVAAGHAAETLKAPTFNGSVSIDSVRSSPSTDRPSPSEGVVPDSASLNAATPGIDELTGITPVAASAPEEATNACTPTLTVSPAAEAAIHLVLSAPCNAGDPVVIRHAGLSFSALTDPKGTLTATIPALRSDAMVSIFLPDSRLVMGQTTVPDAARFTRLAVVWEHPVELTLRVDDGDLLLAGGTVPGGDWPGALVTLGTLTDEAALQSSVYTVAGSDLGSAKITAELRISPATCGQTLRIATLMSSNGVVHSEERMVPVPLCNTAGDILVLKNLAPTLKLATPK